MHERDCSLPANSIYRLVMHALHLFDIPLYIVVIFVLFRINSKAFQNYKYYIIWHTLINVITEFHNCILMLPVVHLPHPLIRATGIMSDLGFSGLFQFYFLSALIIQTGCSVMEMFYFRYQASVFDHKERYFTKFVKFFTFSFRFLTFFFPAITFGTFFYSIQLQEEYKKELAIKDPTIPEITCYSSVLAAPFSDSIMISTMITWFGCMVCTFSVIPSTTIYLNSYLRNTQNMSSGVIRMQKMLLNSLIVQTFVHGIMLGVPNILFIYTIYFGSNFEVAAYLAFGCLTFHGVFSTIAMIIFTKPIQDGIIEIFGNIAKVFQRFTRC